MGRPGGSAEEARLIGATRTNRSIADLIALPDDGHRYELMKGRLIVMPPTAADHGAAGGDLTVEIGLYARRCGGQVYNAGTEFNLTQGVRETFLGADIAYIHDLAVPKDGMVMLPAPPIWL